MAWSMHPNRFISVVLPDPLAPIRATNSPCAMESETSFSTGNETLPSRYVLQMCSSSIRAITSWYS